MWQDRDMQWLDQPSGKRGRSAAFSDAAIQFCLSIKCLFSQPLRQTLSMVQSLLHLASLDSPMPNFNTVCQRQKTLQIQPATNPAPLNLLADSTGIKFLGEGEWKRKKHGAEYQREWRKVHLGINAQTLEIRAIEVPSNAHRRCDHAAGTAHSNSPADEPISTVYADGAYDTRDCLNTIANRQRWR